MYRGPPLGHSISLMVERENLVKEIVKQATQLSEKVGLSQRRAERKTRLSKGIEFTELGWRTWGSCAEMEQNGSSCEQDRKSPT